MKNYILAVCLGLSLSAQSQSIKLRSRGTEVSQLLVKTNFHADIDTISAEIRAHLTNSTIDSKIRSAYITAAIHEFEKSRVSRCNDLGFKLFSPIQAIFEDEKIKKSLRLKFGAEIIRKLESNPGDDLTTVTNIVKRKYAILENPTLTHQQDPTKKIVFGGSLPDDSKIPSLLTLIGK